MESNRAELRVEAEKRGRAPAQSARWQRLTEGGIQGPHDIIKIELLDRRWDEIESEDGVRSYVSNLPKRMLVEQ